MGTSWTLVDLTLFRCSHVYDLRHIRAAKDQQTCLIISTWWSEYKIRDIELLKPVHVLMRYDVSAGLNVPWYGSYLSNGEEENNGWQPTKDICWFSWPTYCQTLIRNIRVVDVATYCYCPSLPAQRWDAGMVTHSKTSVLISNLFLFFLMEMIAEVSFFVFTFFLFCCLWWVFFFPII